MSGVSKENDRESNRGTPEMKRTKNDMQPISEQKLRTPISFINQLKSTPTKCLNSAATDDLDADSPRSPRPVPEYNSPYTRLLKNQLKNSTPTTPNSSLTPKRKGLKLNSSALFKKRKPFYETGINLIVNILTNFLDRSGFK